ncbi:MAG: YHS domain-containing protein [Planctomycetaceae bacterium]|nr:YHS domain-containing protein [Planctomycetaceae bacterium]
MPTSKKDPVCKMDVDVKSAGATVKHKGQNYYFCSNDCKEKFDKEPERYVSGKKSQSK